MKVWDWFFDLLIGSATPHASERTNAAGDAEGGGVATLATPDEAAPWYAPEGATLREPVSMESVELSYEGEAVDRLLVSHLDGRGLSLMPLPRVPETVLRLLSNPECNFSEVAETISQDQATATRVLHAANCWVRGIRQISNLPQAVARLGVTAVRTIMLSESLRAATFMREMRNRRAAQTLWCRAVASGHIMRTLAPFVRIDPEDACVIGLLHDVGNVIVMSLADKYEEMSGSEIDAVTCECLCYRHHQAFGGLIAGQWELPARIRQLIQDHHSYPAGNDPLRNERLALILTDMIVQMLGYAPPQDYVLLESRPVVDLDLASHPDFAEVLRKLPEEIEETLPLF